MANACSSNETNEFSIIENLKKGDKQSFEIIYNKYLKPLYSFAYLHLKDQGLAKDAVHDIFVKLWANRKGLDENLSIKGFLFTSLKNHLLNVVRTKKNEIKKNARILSRTNSFSNETEAAVIFAEYNEMLETGIEKLSGKQKIVYKLSIFKGLTNDEIANKLGISKNTVKNHLSRSAKFIREYIKEKAYI